jgi:hypothetical protein
MSHQQITIRSFRSYRIRPADPLARHPHAAADLVWHGNMFWNELFLLHSCVMFNPVC